MELDGDFRRIAIVGVGLIGGSVAFAARRVFPGAAVVGVDRDDVVTAARAIGATLSRRPVPWLGSPMIGRWLSFCTTGIAEMSNVFRV